MSEKEDLSLIDRFIAAMQRNQRENPLRRVAEIDPAERRSLDPLTPEGKLRALKRQIEQQERFIAAVLERLPAPLMNEGLRELEELRRQLGPEVEVLSGPQHPSTDLRRLFRGRVFERPTRKKEIDI